MPVSTEAGTMPPHLVDGPRHRKVPRPCTIPRRRLGIEHGRKPGEEIKTMDRNKIHTALDYVHKHERCLTKPDGLPRALAVRAAVQTLALTPVETEILCRATLVTEHEYVNAT